MSITMRPLSAMLRTRWTAIGAASAITLGAGGIGVSHATTNSSEGPVAAYFPIEPCRLADTRPGTIGPNAFRSFDGWGSVGACKLPTGTLGLALNVTAVGATTQTNLRFYPQGTDVPGTANLNPTPGAPPTPNAVNVSLNTTNGRFNVYNRFGRVAVVIDVMGYYDDHNHDELLPGLSIIGPSSPEPALRVWNTAPDGTTAVEAVLWGGASGSVAVSGEAQNPNGVGVFGRSYAGDADAGAAGVFLNSEGGLALVGRGSGGGRFKAALKVDNDNTATGMAGYLLNDSAFATSHFENNGAGQVLWLENGGSDSNGFGGGDFITAVNDNGNDVQFRVTTSGEVRSDVGFASPNADFAELLPSVDGLEPGDVLAIGPDGLLTRTTSAAQTTVVGVHSTAPAFLGGQPVGSDPTDHVPLAVVGVVPVKVSAENGAIAPGDLLVSASIAGHAMRADGQPAVGTVIGKALEPLLDGVGTISVLITLQ